MSDNNLTKSEVKLVKRYYLWPSLAIPAFIVAIALVVETFIFFLIYDGYLMGYMDEKYIALMIVGFAFFMVVFIVMALVPRIGTTRSKWLNIVEKANSSSDEEKFEINSLDQLDDIHVHPIGIIEQPAKGKGTMHLIRNTAKEIRKAAKEIADHYHIDLPNYRLWQKLVVLVPTIGLLCMFIPECMGLVHYNNGFDKEAIETNGIILQTYLQDEMGFENTYGPDIDGAMSNFNYVSGYYTDYEKNIDLSVDFCLDRDGNVNGINVHNDIHYDEPQANIDELNKIVAKMFEILEKSGVQVANEDLYKYREIPKEFSLAYLEQQENNIQLYQDIEGDNNDTLSVTFTYDPYNEKYSLNPKLRYSVRYHVYEY